MHGSYEGTQYVDFRTGGPQNRTEAPGVPGTGVRNPVAAGHIRMCTAR